MITTTNQTTPTTAGLRLASRSIARFSACAPARLSSIVCLFGMLVVLLGAMPARSEATNHVAYEAYWLTNKALGKYVKLVLTRRPLADLPKGSQSTNLPLSDCEAVIVTTYARDSIWNVDQQPFKPLAGVAMVATNSIVINGETFACTQAKLEIVLQLMRNPSGTIPIHRIFGPLTGQEEAIRTLASRLERQLAAIRKAQDPPLTPLNAPQPRQ